MKWINLNLILSDIVTTLNIYVVIKNLSKLEFKLKNFLLFFVSVFVLYIINFNLFSGLYRSIFSIITMLFGSYIFLFKKDISKSLYYSIWNSFICLTSEILITPVLTMTLKFTVNEYKNFEYSLFLFSILVFIITTILTRINFINTKIRFYEKKLSITNTEKIYIFYLIILFLLFGFNSSIKFSASIDYYISIVIIIFVILTIILFLFNKIKRENAESKYKEMMEYVSKYEQIINEQGKKNHEFNNQLMVLNGYIGNKKKLKEYLDTIIKDHTGGKNYTIEQLSYFPDGGIKGLIYHKLSRMEENEIRPYLYIAKDVKDIFETKFDVNTYSDITKLFGVYLDNAIEAAKEAEKKEIEIDMKIDDKYLIVMIGNTYSKEVDINKIGKKGFTTKGIGHGFGLSLVKDISKKNSKIETFNDVTNDMFKQTILIDLK